MKILCFANSKTSISSELKSNSGELFKTLVKLYLYPNHVSVNHWKQEIAAFLNKVPRTKGNKKFPNKHFILKNTWEIYEDAISNMIEPIIEDYGDTVVMIDVDDLYEKCEAYFNWIAGELSSNGFVSNKRIYNKLDSIFNLT